MKQLITATTSVFSLFGSIQAFGDSFPHDYYSRARSPYTSDLYLTNHISYDQTKLEKARFSPGSSLKEQESFSDANYNGQTFQASLGMEHFRFIQTGVNFSHSQLTLTTDKRASLQGQEFGAHLKVILSSPVLNVALFGGPHISQKTYLNPHDNGVLQGSGYSFGLEFVRFVSPKVSLFASGGVTREELQKSTGSAALQKVNGGSTRLGGGFSLWF